MKIALMNDIMKRSFIDKLSLLEALMYIMNRLSHTTHIYQECNGFSNSEIGSEIGNGLKVRKMKIGNFWLKKSEI